MAEPSTILSRTFPVTLGSGDPGSDAVSVSVVAPQSRFALRLAPELAKSLNSVEGFLLDLPLNHCAESSGRISARLGPDEWLLMALENGRSIIADRLSTSLSGHLHSLVDVGHRNVGIEVSGKFAQDVLNVGCPLDLDTTVVPRGAAVRTLLGKAEIVLMHLQDRPAYRIECWRSYATYVHAFLRAGAREFLR
jgi:sarcosine oxidase subunit gamma